MIKEIKVSYFIGGAGNTIPEEGTMTLEEIIKVMTDESFGYSKVPKNRRPYFTISGQFSYRNNMSLIDNSYTWLCPIDIDYGENEGVDMNMVQNILCSDDSVIFCAKSPSGNGLKAIIRLKKDAYKIEDHYKVLKNLYRKLEKSLNCVFDDAQAKLSQPFYFTFDENAYINYDAIELDCDYTIPKEINILTGDICSTKKDYLVDNKCNEILNLTSNKWIEIGKIGYTLGGWFKAGHFNYTEDEIKIKLKDAVDKNVNIQNKQHKYEQIDLTFKNGFENPIYIKEEKLVDVSEVEWEEIKQEVIEEEPLTREELKRYHRALGKAPVYTVIEDSGSVFIKGKTYKENKYLLYPILKEGQLGCFYGVTGDGKTVLFVEFANCIAEGYCSWDLFRVETSPQKVLYIDFELGELSMASRYSQRDLSDNLIIWSPDVNIYNNIIGFDNKQTDRLDRAISYIEELAIKFDSKVIFIDNLSNIADQVEQAAEADRFISDLYGRMKSLGYTIFIISHTPKIPHDVPINLNQLKGSTSLPKTFETIIGFKRSKEKNISYIKQMKSRNLDNILDEDNVAKFKFIQKPNNWSIELIGFDEESALLPEKAHTGGKPMKYDNKIKSEVLYEINILAIQPKEVMMKYGIPHTMLYKFKQDLKDNKYGLEKEYQKFCKFKSDELQTNLLKNKILNGIEIK